MCIKNQDHNINYCTKKTIEKLFNFYEDELYEDTNENKDYLDQIIKIEKPFYESMTAEQKKQFEEIIELHSLNGAITDKNIFVFAFRLAINLILESK